MSHRTESDFLGPLNVPSEALYGVHTTRALDNFKAAGRPVRKELVHAYGEVKLAAIRTNARLGFLDARIAAPLEEAAQEMSDGRLDAHVLVDALQGGAGTATNMNVNEVLANRALQIMGQPLGGYDTISPLEHVNLHQSTNDTYPTALRVAAIRSIRGLVAAVLALQETFQDKEREFASVIKLGRTQTRDAVPIALGREMGAYAEALSRDRWRLYKCEERLRVVNLGGTAIGTGLGAPRKYIFGVVDELRSVTGIGLVRAENLVDMTQNQDLLVEVSGMVKTLATSLIKISSDLRLMSSGPEAGLAEIRLPARQVGSSIMPGKVNPVVPELVTQVCLRAMASDSCISQAVTLGQLELNAFLPLIADELLSALSTLTAACESLDRHCVRGIEVDRDRCAHYANAATGAVTALVSEVGHQRAEALLRDPNARLREAVGPELYDAAVSAANVGRLGFGER